jgi:hypothetical protein
MFLFSDCSIAPGFPSPCHPSASSIADLSLYRLRGFPPVNIVFSMSVVFEREGRFLIDFLTEARTGSTVVLEGPLHALRRSRPSSREKF